MFGGLMTETQFLDGGALLLGVGLMFSGVRAIRRREVEAEGHHEGASAVRLGWLWFVLGALFVAGCVRCSGPDVSVFWKRRPEFGVDLYP
jgi:hypothetical protein